ncbi:tripartite tricarboxylate transporter substrate binding protein [Metabacillus sp. Hm71]|uniref:tripartite tricarboxylate transporter substrate binding protein n=1 Tax=Metabacillus sp. Hm71 TaxID=3450743 RepID=UPI003F4292EF
MKKFLYLLLIGIVSLSLTACEGNLASSNANDTTNEKTSNYPAKPITFLVPTGAGGGLDTTTRALTKVLTDTKLLSQTTIVENKPGGGQVVGTVEFATKEKGNDYKLLVTSTPFLLNHLKKEGNSPVSYRDITPLAQLVTEHDVLAVSADSKYKDLKALYKDLAADPTRITFAGGSGPGAFDHLNVVFPAMKAGVDPKSIKYVSYDGGGEALTALLGGNADVISSDVTSVYEYLKAGKVRILGVSSPERLPGQFKEIPTYKEQGVDAELTNWRGIFGPANMSDDAKKYWEEQINSLIETNEWKQELEKQGWQDGYLSSTDFVKAMEKEEQMYKELYTELGMAK